MRRESAAISPVSEVISAVRAGEIVILVDDEDRENEGDLVFAAEFVTPEKINFLARHGRGLICMPITEEHALRLGLRPMVEQNRSRHGTNFTASIEAAEGIATIADLIEYRSRNESLVQRVGEREIETPWGVFRLVSYRDQALGALHLAL